MANTQRLSYIQGLRGIAILLIFLFHLMPNICPSGYLGVDIFFVISGYLLIGRQLVADEPFRPLDFFKKRSLRLLPPYFGLIIAVTLISICLFPAHEMLESARLIKASLSGQANVFLDQLSGNYFSPNTRHYPLMHLWYMGVLLQCYLLFPLFFYLWSFTRCRKVYRVATMLILGAASFATAFLYLLPLPYNYAIDTYYWTSARIWEFALGGLFFVLPKPQGSFRSHGLAVVTLVGLIICAFIPLPNNSAGVFIGALGGCLLLRYGSVWQRYSPLNSRIALFLGAISFSLYLVHWPCICFAEYLLCQQPALISAGALVALILSLSVLYKKAVEDHQFSLLALLLLGGMAGILYKAQIKTHGFRNFLHRDANRIIELSLRHTDLPELEQESPMGRGSEGIRANQNSPHAHPGALLYHCGDRQATATFVVMGDSHGDDFARAMHTLGEQNAWHGVHLNAYVVPFWNASLRTSPLIAPGQYFDEDKAQRIMHWLESHPELKTVFIAQQWCGRMTEHRTWSGELVQGDIVQTRVNELRELCRQLHSIGKQVVLVTDNPAIGTENPRHLLSAYLMRQEASEFPIALCRRKTEYEQKEGAFNKELDSLAQEGLCQVLHREKAFFPSETFKSYDGHALYHRDSHHLTIDGGLLSLSACLEQLRHIMQQD